MKKRFATWCAKKNRFFSDKLGDGDQFTNGEVLAAHMILILFIPAIFAAQALIESL